VRVGAALLPGLLCLAAAGCGVAGMCPPSPEVEIQTTDSLDSFGEFYGVAIRECDAATQILILETAPPALWTRLIVHELMHAAGLQEHEPDPDCYLYEDILGTLPPQPCPQELARLLAVEGTFTVRVRDAVLFSNTIAAAAILNSAVGREMFLVLPAP
jgi:hypothetical protein